MARKAKQIASEQAGKEKIDAQEFQRVIEEIKRQQKNAAEYQGMVGKHTQNAVERYGLEKTALTFTRRLANMEETKRQAVIRNLIQYFDFMEFFDQEDMFSDLVQLMEEIVERAKSGRNSRKPDEAMETLLN